jgi:hypothetical protein
MKMNSKSQKSLVNVLWASKEKKDIERHFAQMAMGVLSGLKGNRLSVEQAEKDMFNLDAYRAARRQRVDRRLIEFLEWGMELEDVLEVAPGNLEESYAKMGHLLESFFAHRHLPPERTSASSHIVIKGKPTHPRRAKKLAMTG